MGVVISPDSELAKELQRWEMFPRHNVNGEILPAGRPYVFRPYPRMLYKAIQARSGKYGCMAAPVTPFGWRDQQEYERAVAEADAFTKACQRIVGSEAEQKVAEGEGWRETAAEAMAFQDGLQADIARAAAEAAYTAQGMTDKARREFEAAGDATEFHVTDVKGTKKGPKPVTGRPDGE
jgi:hypothetical protein